jgi:hypothetical protein
MRSLEEDAALHLIKVPAWHHDPFDRMLVCQSACSRHDKIDPRQTAFSLSGSDHLVIDARTALHKIGLRPKQKRGVRSKVSG